MKKKQKITPRTRPHLQKEKQGPSWVHAEPSHWLHEISISKTVCHHFWPGLMTGAEIWGQWGPVLGNEFRGMCLLSSIFSFATSLFDWSITKQILKLSRLPQCRSIHTKHKNHLYRFQKDNGTKGGATGNMLGNMLRTLKTCWELDENTLGTTKPKKSNPQILPPLSAPWALSLVAWKFYFQNCLSPFQPGRIPPL
jgi:hypothetical protein